MCVDHVGDCEGEFVGRAGAVESVFVLEYDTGSEHLPQLTAKLPGYGHLAEAMSGRGHTCPLLLFCFPRPRREQAARRALAACYDAPALRIATTSINPEHTSPAGPVWLPLATAHTTGLLALSALDAALPDPWEPHRADHLPARQEAAQAEHARRFYRLYGADEGR